MKVEMYRLAVISLLAFFLTSCTNNITPKTEQKITVAVAASLTLPLQDIGVVFKKKYHTKVDLIPASSGVLTAQIIHDAPFDVFISANAAYPEKLEKLGKTVGDPETFALGLLVLWSKKDLQGMPPAKFLSGVKTLSIANPDLAPFGAAAVKWLKEENLYEKMKPKLVYGENIGSVNQFIASGAVDAALTSVSAVHTPQLYDKGYWAILPASEIAGIPHVAAIIPQKTSRAAAKQFLEFLSSDAAQTILARYGYAKPGKP
jgi:molybdate transport system substrate-binding protein